MAQYHTMLVPTDFSHHAAAARKLALNLAGPLGAQVHLVHAQPEPLEWFSTFGVEVPPLPVPELRRGASVRLDQEFADVREAGLAGEWHLREGNAVEQILAVAEEIGADVIVMGTHGRGALAHAVLGSVAERVVRLAHCPVLTLKAES